MPLSRNPPATPLEAVVFDLGGVLIDWNPTHLYGRIFAGDAGRMARFFAEICTPAWNEALDGGRDIDEAIAALVAEHPAEREAIHAWRDRWPEMLGGAIDGTVALADGLRAAGMPLHAITNWSADTFHHATARFDFLGWFGHTVVSGRIGICKPQAGIFDHFLKVSGLAAEHCLFIDDRQANTAAAATLGFHTHHFDGPDGLRQRLGEFRLAGSAPA